jgi:hypothetical protein
MDFPAPSDSRKVLLYETFTPSASCALILDGSDVGPSLQSRNIGPVVTVFRQEETSRPQE